MHASSDTSIADTSLLPDFASGSLASVRLRFCGFGGCLGEFSFFGLDIGSLAETAIDEWIVKCKS